MKTIGIYPPVVWPRLGGLLGALAELEPVRFQPVADPLPGLAGLILVGVSVAAAQAAVAQSGGRVFAFVAGTVPAETASEIIQFADTPSLPPALRGQTLEENHATAVLPSVLPGAEVLAVRGRSPVWVRMSSPVGTLDLFAGDPPDLQRETHLYAHCQPGRFLQLVPLIQFLREAAAPLSLLPPPLRACFMFDDPNLHWTSYGHLDYRGLLGSARKHGYHVAFATIPLDACYARRAAATLLLDNREWLSLLVHGNNHTRCELAQIHPGDTALRLAAQSLRRMERLEQRTGLRVPRVMAAPHGACRDGMADALLRVGYEAACISRGSIMTHNGDRPWPVVAGLRPAEFLGSGFPVMPRIGLNRRCHANVVLAAYFGQPIIFVGHHQDVRSGYEILEEVARFVNRLPHVRWTNLEEIARANLVQRSDGETLRVKTYARRFRLQPPAGIKQVELELAWHPADGRTQAVVARQNGHDLTFMAETPRLVLPVAGDAAMDVSWNCSDAVNYRSVPPPRTTVWPVVRRVLTEARDRLQGLGRPISPAQVDSAAK